MFTQNPLGDGKHFIITMAEHMEFCAQLAKAYGNDRFERIDPYEEVLFTVGNHDRGWDRYDEQPLIEPETGVPYIMAKTPAAEVVVTNKGSPDFNERHHAYCGLLSSMHIWGLYNKRYGYSSFVLRNRPGTTSIPVRSDDRLMIDQMLAGELERQARLKTQLEQSAATGWTVEKHLFQNYKQLQFFDTLAIYFHLYRAGERGDETFICVPMNQEEDAVVIVRELGEGRYSLDPFPFADRIKLTCRGRYMKPLPSGCSRTEASAILKALPGDNQSYELVPAR